MLWLEQEIHFHLTRNEEQLQQLARASSPVHPRASTFEPQSRSLLANQTGLNQIFWLDASGALRAALPSATAEAVTVGEATPAIPLQETMRLARALAKPTYSPTYAIVLNDAQFEVHVPEFSNGRYAGMVVGIYSIRRILDELVPWWLAERYRISIVDDSGVLGSKSMVAAVNSQMLYQVPFDPPGHSLILRAEAYEPKTSLARNLLIFSVLALAGSMLWSLWALRRHIQWRQAAELALRKEYAFRAAMEDSLATGLLARDHDGSIIYVNPAFCRMVGLSAAELIGRRPPMPYWADEHLDETRSIHDRILAGQGPEEGFELKLKRGNGEVIDVLIHEAPLIDARGQQSGWMGSMVDITERKLAEERARQQQERLQSTARLVAMGEMASSIAHELNQPLAAISSYCTGAANLLRNQAPATDVVPALDKAVEQAQRAGKVIRRIYSLARHGENRLERVHLGAHIDAALALMEVDIRQKSIRVTLDLEEEAVVEGDPVLLEQALFNLLRNAVESMRDTAPDQ
ncbi:MAG: PAS domain S-box protein, partial [Proteobacteria bacterium]|nr:PAS domain S-box protein [Pseudomonadota bacterium]